VIEFEKFLAPWEHDGDGKALDEPAEVEPGKLKKFIYDLLSDKEKLGETVADKEAELANAQETLTTMQREKETEDERRAREDKEREERYAALEAEKVERDKVKAISKHFKEQGIEADRAERLAGRVTGKTEKDWISSAEELVEDGFRLSDKPAVEQEREQEEEETDGLTSTPRRVVRSDGKPPKTAKESTKSFAEELDELIPRTEW